MYFRSIITPFTALVLTLIACQPVQPNDQIEVVDEYSDLQLLFDSARDKTWVVNFWATSCPPCLKEMPHFRELDNAYNEQDVRILLVSLDKTEDLDKRVYPFIEKHGITSEVIVLGDQNYSAWTDEIDPSWYGALPATMIFDGEEKLFKFGAYSNFEELEADLLRLKATD